MPSTMLSRYMKGHHAAPAPTDIKADLRALVQRHAQLRGKLARNSPPASTESATVMSMTRVGQMFQRLQAVLFARAVRLGDLRQQQRG